MFLQMFCKHLNKKAMPEVQNVLQLYIPQHLKKQLLFGAPNAAYCGHPVWSALKARGRSIWGIPGRLPLQGSWKGTA